MGRCRPSDIPGHAVLSVWRRDDARKRVKQMVLAGAKVSCSRYVRIVTRRRGQRATFPRDEDNKGAICVTINIL